MFRSFQPLMLSARGMLLWDNCLFQRSLSIYTILFVTKRNTAATVRSTERLIDIILNTNALFFMTFSFHIMYGSELLGKILENGPELFFVLGRENLVLFKVIRYLRMT